MVLEKQAGCAILLHTLSGYARIGNGGQGIRQGGHGGAVVCCLGCLGCLGCLAVTLALGIAVALAVGGVGVGGVGVGGGFHSVPLVAVGVGGVGVVAGVAVFHAGTYCQAKTIQRVDRACFRNGGKAVTIQKRIVIGGHSIAPICRKFCALGALALALALSALCMAPF